MSEDIKVPATGSDGTMEVIEISVAVGDQIETDETIVVLESDKATVEVPSSKSGKVESLSIKVGDKVKEGDLLLKLITNDEQPEKQDSAEVLEQPVNSSPNPVNSTPNIVSDESSENDANTGELKVEQVVVPDLGGSADVEVIEVLAEVGELLEEDQTLLVLETDKATMEIPCPVSGKLLTLNIKVGDKVSAGDLIAELEVEVTKLVKTEAENSTGSSEKQSEKAPTHSHVETVSQRPQSLELQKENGPVHAGPSVRKFAREHGVDLTSVKANGPKDRILIEDVTAYIKAQVQKAQSGLHSSANVAGINPVQLPDFTQFGDVSVSSMTKVHFKTAENMQRSWSLPHVTQFDEADITEMEVFRKKQKALADQKGIKLTPMAFMLKACAHVLQALPQFNVALDLAQQQIIQKQYIHIGFAVDTPHGLFVPVIRDVDKKGIWQLAAECQDLANRAREKKLSPMEMQGGCFTISSLGAIGGTAFTPIVNAPEVAILGLSKAQMKPVYDEDKGFVPRLLLPVSLSYDHRAVNGADGARFTSLLSKVLGDLRELLL